MQCDFFLPIFSQVKNVFALVFFGSATFTEIFDFNTGFFFEDFHKQNFQRFQQFPKLQKLDESYMLFHLVQGLIRFFVQGE